MDNQSQPGGQPQAGQQPPQPAPPSGDLNTKSYDFITNPKKKKKKNFLNGGSSLQRYAILFIGGALILILIFVVLSLITGGGGDSRDRLIALAKSQNSLIELADNGVKNSTNTNLLNVSSTVKLVVTTDRVNIVDSIDGEVKNEVIKGDLGDLETTLDTAKTNGTYDETYKTTLLQSLADYQNRLQEVSDSGPTTSTQTILETSNLNVQTIFLTIKD